MDAPPNQSPKDDEDMGPECRRCGCFDLPVYYTRRRLNKILRRRVCAHCGQAMTTIERDISAVGTGGRAEAAAKKSSTNGTISNIPRGKAPPAR